MMAVLGALIDDFPIYSLPPGRTRRLSGYFPIMIRSVSRKHEVRSCYQSFLGK